MLDEKNAYDNFVHFVGYTPPQNAIDAESLIKQRPDPEEPRAGGRPARPVRGQPGAAPAERRGRAPLGQRLVEVQGRLMHEVALDLARARPPGRRSGSSIFFLVAFYAVVAVAFGNQDTLSQPVPFWNPLDWNVGYLLDVLREHLARRPVPHRLPADVRVRRDRDGAVARASATRSPTSPRATPDAGGASCCSLLILPFWINYLMRMLAWINLLSPDGWGTQCLHDIGIERLFLRLGLLGRAAAAGSTGSPSTVIIALVYGYIPFLILPLFAALDRIDQRQIEAARDLGASPFERLPARDAAALGARDPRRHGADRAADVRRLLHAGPRLGVDPDEHDRQPDRRVHAAGLGEGRRAPCSRCCSRSSCSC